MKLTARQTLIAAAVALLPLAASAQLSYNIGAVSLYKSRGIDQDSRATKAFRPSIQGGIDYAFSNGFYVGNWNATGKFANANIEMDVYAGYKAKLGGDAELDVGFVRYIYPNSGAGFNGNDVYIGLNYGMFSAKYYNGVSGSVDKNKYLTLGATLPISDKVAFKASVGWVNPNGPANDYNDYSLGVSYAINDGLSASIMAAGANKRAITGAAGKSRLILGISQTF